MDSWKIEGLQFKGGIPGVESGHWQIPDETTKPHSPKTVHTGKDARTHTHTHASVANTGTCSRVALYLKKSVSSVLLDVQNNLLLCTLPFIFKITVKAAPPTTTFVSCYSSASNTLQSSSPQPPWAISFLLPSPILFRSLHSSPTSSLYLMIPLFLPRLSPPPFISERQLMLFVPICLQVTFRGDYLFPSVCSFCPLQNTLFIEIMPLLIQD